MLLDFILVVVLVLIVCFFVIFLWLISEKYGICHLIYCAFCFIRKKWNNRKTKKRIVEKIIYGE
jgi:ABC-type phosphate transport system permease subunit